MVGKRLVGANGFEPSTSWSRISSRNTILLARLALFCVEHADMGRYSAAIGLKSDSTIYRPYTNLVQPWLIEPLSSSIDAFYWCFLSSFMSSGGLEGSCKRY